jgi:hypothetical protein
MLESVEGSIVLDVTDKEMDESSRNSRAILERQFARFLHDLTTLVVDSKAAVWRGFVRGRLLPFRLGDGLPEKK